MQYNLYLQSEHWKNTRQEKLNQHNWCSVCKTDKNLQTHHKTYTSPDGESILFNERPTHLVILCQSCHRFIQYYFGINVKKLNKKICRVRRLIELGINKKSAFYIVSKDITGQLFISIRNRLSN